MAFADIDYFGDSSGFGGNPAWSGRVSSVSELDGFDWGRGRKSPFSSFSNRTSFDMERMIDDAIKRSERTGRRNGLFGDSDVLHEINRKDRGQSGVSVGILGGTEKSADMSTFTVGGASSSANFPMASRVAFNSDTESLNLFVRDVRISGIGRVVGVGPEQVVTVPTSSRNKGFFFYLEDDGSGQKMIKGCRVFLGCLGSSTRCDDVVVSSSGEHTYYAHVDFSGFNTWPVLTVDENSMSGRQNMFSFPLYKLKDGSVVQGNPGMVVLPTFSVRGYYT